MMSHTYRLHGIQCILSGQLRTLPSTDASFYRIRILLLLIVVYSVELTHDILQGICSGIVDTLWRWWWWSWLCLCLWLKFHILLGVAYTIAINSSLDRRWRWWFRRSNIEFLLSKLAYSYAKSYDDSPLQHRRPEWSYRQIVFHQWPSWPSQCFQSPCTKHTPSPHQLHRPSSCWLL